MKFDFLNGDNKQKKIIYILLSVFLIGIAFILLNTEEKIKDQVEKELTSPYTVEEEVYDHEEMEKKLEKKLSKIDGAGKVEVMITMKNKGEIILNKDIPYQSSQIFETGQEGGKKESVDREENENTVLVQKSDGSEEAIVIKELLPEVSGALILAEGGDRIDVKNNLIQAAKVLLDLPAHKIEVMKMVQK